MNIEYVLLADDFVAFSDHQSTRAAKAPGSRRSFWIFFVYLGLQAGMSGAYDVARSQVSWFGAISVLAFLLFLFFNVFKRPLNRYYFRRSLNRGASENLLGWRRVSIAAAGMTTSTEKASLTTYWDAVQRIAATANHLFFYLSDTSAVIVPRRAFESDEAFDDFIETARRFRKAARNAGPEREDGKSRQDEREKDERFQSGDERTTKRPS